KTANCSYVERWDEKLNKVRYVRERIAALCTGASMYRPGKNPTIITLRRSTDSFRHERKMSRGSSLSFSAGSRCFLCRRLAEQIVRGLLDLAREVNATGREV